MVAPKKEDATKVASIQEDGNDGWVLILIYASNPTSFSFKHHFRSIILGAIVLQINCFFLLQLYRFSNGLLSSHKV